MWIGALQLFKHTLHLAVHNGTIAKELHSKLESLHTHNAIGSSGILKWCQNLGLVLFNGVDSTLVGISWFVRFFVDFKCLAMILNVFNVSTLPEIWFWLWIHRLMFKGISKRSFRIYNFLEVKAAVYIQYQLSPLNNDPLAHYTTISNPNKLFPDPTNFRKTLSLKRKIGPSSVFDLDESARPIKTLQMMQMKMVLMIKQDYSWNQCTNKNYTQNTYSPLLHTENGLKILHGFPCLTI